MADPQVCLHQLTSSPIPVVASTPVRDTTNPEAPQFSVPQVSEPQPVFISVVIVGEPKPEVNPEPVSVTTGLLLSPQGSSPHSPRPQHCLAAERGVPNDVVADKPVN